MLNGGFLLHIILYGETGKNVTAYLGEVVYL